MATNQLLQNVHAKRPFRASPAQLTADDLRQIEAALPTEQEWQLARRLAGCVEAAGADVDFVANGQFRATYDFASDGGAKGTITFGANFPAKAYIKRASLDVLTPLASGGAASAALQFRAANDIVADGLISAGPWNAAVFADAVPTGAAATFAGKLAAEGKLALVVTVADLTGGTFVVTGEYGVSE